MKEIVNKLHENRQIQLAKEILESNGYKVEDTKKEINEESDNEAYKEFIKKCTDNATWKKVNSICSKYSYRLSNNSCVDVLPKGGKLISIKIFSDKTNEYLPEIYFDHTRFGEEVMEFKIQTTSYGSLTLEEHTKFIEAVTNANNLIKELEGIDFYTLYNDESDY